MYFFMLVFNGGNWGEVEKGLDNWGLNLGFFMY